jgi:hypothetical protein
MLALFMPTKTRRSARGKNTTNGRVVRQKRLRRQPTKTVAKEQTMATAETSMRSEKPAGGGNPGSTQETPASQLSAFTEFGELWWNAASQMAASYIDTTERFWKNALALQESLTDSTKNTPWAPLFQSQCALTEQWVKGPVDFARKLWRIEKKAAEQSSARDEAAAR